MIADKINRALLRTFYTSFITSILCLGFCVSGLYAAHGDYKKNGSYYVKVIDGNNTFFKCDEYTQTVTDIRNNAEVEIQVAHPILAAVAFCSDPEMMYHSVSKIYSRTSDEWFYDPIPVYWSAKVSCEDDYGVATEARKVVLYCWEEEMLSGLPQ